MYFGKHLKVLFAAGILSGVLFGAAAQSEKKSGRNLVHNGDIEAKGTNKQIIGWTPIVGKKFCSVTDTESHAGHYSLKIELPNADKLFSGIWESASIPYEGGKLKFSLWAKTENILRGEKGYHLATASLYYFNAGGKIISHSSCAFALTGTKPWEFYELHSLLPPPGTKSISIRCALLRCAGTAWFDDIQLQNLSPPATGDQAASDTAINKMRKDELERLQISRRGDKNKTQKAAGGTLVVESVPFTDNFRKANGNYPERVTGTKIKNGNFIYKGKPVILFGVEAQMCHDFWLYKLLGINYVSCKDSYDRGMYRLNTKQGKLS